jgi:hypothetical protein
LLRFACNDVGTQCLILATPCARAVLLFRRPESKGRRECRVHAAPAVSCAKSARKDAHEHTGTVGTLRHSLRSGFTAYAVLSPATNSSCHRHQRIRRVRSGWTELASADLAPATGVRTTRLCRTHQRRSSCALCSLTDRPPCEPFSRPTLPRPPQPVPTFVTMANAPLAGQGARVIAMICPTG